MENCPKCQREVDSSQMSYDANGDPECKFCAAAKQSGQASQVLSDPKLDPKSDVNLWGGSLASAFLGLATCVTAALGRIYFLLIPISIFFGGLTLYRLLSDKQTKLRLGTMKFIAILSLCVAGIAFGGLGGLLSLLALDAE